MPPSTSLADAVTGPRVLRWWPYTALALAAVLVVVLVAENRSLRSELADLRRQQWFPRVGDILPSSRAETLDGDSVMIGFGPPGSRQVLFVFDTRCGWCRRSLPAWRSIAEQLGAGASKVVVFGVSLDPEPETRAYALSNRLSFPIVVFHDERMKLLYHLGGVPITLVMDDAGEVLYSRLGSVENDLSTDSVIAAVRREVSVASKKRPKS